MFIPQKWLHSCFSDICCMKKHMTLAPVPKVVQKKNPVFRAMLFIQMGIFDLTILLIYCFSLNNLYLNKKFTFFRSKIPYVVICKALLLEKQGFFFEQKWLPPFWRASHKTFWFSKIFMKD